VSYLLLANHERQPRRRTNDGYMVAGFRSAATANRRFSVINTQPGLNHARLINLMTAAVERCRLDLAGRVVLTEAASGPYIVTPVLAALGGADFVYALTRSTPHGTVDEIRARTLALARFAGVEKCIRVIAQKTPAVVGEADVVTNSGHLRPIDAEMISWMKPTAVIPLMFEAWEFRPSDLELAAAQQRGILVAGTNERHPDVDVFSFLGIMAVKLLVDAGIAVYGSRVLVLCDNPFAAFIERGLTRAGATVELRASPMEADAGPGLDAVLVALHPRATPVFKAAEARLTASRWPGAVVAQFWGDLDRSALTEAGVPYWPADGPAPGHMGMLPSGVGPEPVVRLQCGGLKVGEVLLQSPARRAPADEEFLDAI
jgi:hypothetical protein